MAQGSTYSKEDIQRAACTWFACNNDLKTAELMGIPRETVKSWRTGQSAWGGEIWDQTLTKLHHEKRSELAARLCNYAVAAIDQAFAKISDMSGKDAMITLGIAVEKLQLLLNQPTSITMKVGEGERLDQLKRQIERLNSKENAEQHVTH